MKGRRIVKRISELLFTAVFIAVSGYMLFLTVTEKAETVSFYENRNLAEFSEPEVSEIMDGSYSGILEKYLADHAPFRNEMLELKTVLDLDVFSRPVVNDIVVKHDILLPSGGYGDEEFDFSELNLENLRVHIRDVKSAADEVGAPFYFAAVPEQYSMFHDKYPDYMKYDSELEDREAEYMAGLLKAHGIFFLDLRQDLGGEYFRDLYGSRVDNHYSMQGAFRTYQLILEQINKNFKAGFPVLSDDEVTFKKLSNPYLGSHERKLLGKKDVKESLYYVEFDEEVPYTRYDGGNEIAPFTFLFPKNDREKVSYSFYMGGDIGECMIDTYRDDLPTVLLYGDSVTNPIECVLYASCNKMYSLDLRYYEGSVADYIREIEPDYVITVRSFSSIMNSYANGRA